MNCKHCNVEIRYIHKNGRPIPLENGEQHFCTLYELLKSVPMSKRKDLLILNPLTRMFKQLISYFSNDEKLEIRTSFLKKQKVAYRYWLMWLNIAIDRMEKDIFKNYVEKVGLIDGPDRID